MSLQKRHVEKESRGEGGGWREREREGWRREREGRRVAPFETHYHS